MEVFLGCFQVATMILVIQAILKVEVTELVPSWWQRFYCLAFPDGLKGENGAIGCTSKDSSKCPLLFTKNNRNIFFTFDVICLVVPQRNQHHLCLISIEYTRLGNIEYSDIICPSQDCHVALIIIICWELLSCSSASPKCPSHSGGTDISNPCAWYPEVASIFKQDFWNLWWRTPRITMHPVLPLTTLPVALIFLSKSVMIETISGWGSKIPLCPVPGVYMDFWLWTLRRIFMLNNPVVSRFILGSRKPTFSSRMWLWMELTVKAILCFQCLHCFSYY